MSSQDASLSAYVENNRQRVSQLPVLDQTLSDTYCVPTSWLRATESRDAAKIRERYMLDRVLAASCGS